MSSAPDWGLYRSFLAVARLGSLSAASRSLGMTQPTLGRHIEVLEAALGVELFVRSPRGLRPTAVAQELLPQVEAIAFAAAALVRTADSGRAEMAGTVRVSAGENMGVERLPPILAALRRIHPGIDIQLSLSNDVHDLLAREADVAVRQTQPRQKALLAKKLPPTVVGLYAHREYLEHRGEPKTLGDLGAHDLIGFDTPTPATQAVLRQNPGMESLRFALRVDSDLAQLAAIRSGLGIGLTQTAIAEADPSLRRVLASQFSLSLPLWIVMHENLKSNAICRAVFDALVAGLSGQDGR